jgi:23S rRNA pseudouridine1911/1915/1917 synthase
MWKEILNQVSIYSLPLNSNTFKNYNVVPNSREKTFIFYQSQEGSDARLDKFLCSKKCFNLSRAKIQGLIKSGAATVNGERKKPGYVLRPGDSVKVLLLPLPELLEITENVEFDILYEDNSIIVIDKPPGLVVHPPGGLNKGTLVHGLIDREIKLSHPEDKLRPGIVHRLDKDTSGVMVVAKNDYAHEFLSSQFKQRKIKKKYLSIVHGSFGQENGMIDLPINRHPTKRKEMSISLLSGRTSITEWMALDTFSHTFSLLSISLKTGRTHQIRVHMAYMGHPVAGDLVYGYGKRWWKKEPLKIRECLNLVGRQMLHAELLGFTHPNSKKYVEFKASLPDDMNTFLEWLNKNRYYL